MIVFDDVDAPFPEPCGQTALDPGYAIPARPVLGDVVASQVVYGTVGGSSPALKAGDLQLVRELRDALLAPLAHALLVRAAVMDYRVRDEGASTGLTLARSHALAQLAVTGRAAYASFRSPQDADLLDPVATSIQRETGRPANRPRLQASVATVLDTAYETAWALRGAPDVRRDLRPSLGWIAVGPADDHPHRPVNVPSAPYPQYDVELDAPARMTVRCMIATTRPAPAAPAYPGPGTRSLPPEPSPWLPDDEHVVLYIHGHGSRLEEAVPLVPWIQAVGRERGERFTVISADLPSRGYTTMLDPAVLATPPEFTRRVPTRPSDFRYPALEFMEDFIDALLGRLAALVGRPLNDVTVVGGSLGGNLSLRLANPTLGPARHTRLRTWVRRHAAWSPASVWDSYADARADELKDSAVRTTRDKARDGQSRLDFFEDVFFARPGGALNWLTLIVTFGGVDVPAPSQQWYRGGDWEACRELSIQGATWDIADIFNDRYVKWHWRIAYEQLLFSHRDTPSGGGRLYRAIRRPLLLLAGTEDNFRFTHIHDRTKDMALDMPDTPGRALLLRNTGHSIHSERPRLLATQIVDFILDNR